MSDVKLRDVNDTLKDVEIDMLRQKAAKQDAALNIIYGVADEDAGEDGGAEAEAEADVEEEPGE